MLESKSVRAACVAALAFVCLVPMALAQPAGYYGGVDTTSAASLRATVHEAIDDHQRYPYTASSTDVWDILNLADEDPNNSGRIVDLYRNASLAKISGGNGAYNREHVWPKSYGFPNDGSSNYAYTDCHHLFASDVSYNAERGNMPFRDCDAGCDEWATEFTDGRGGGSGSYPADSNWARGQYAAGTWETWDGRKGDVARALFYMDLRYEGGSNGNTGVTEPDLRLTDSESLIDASRTGSNEYIAYMGMLSTLLEWHALDPVDSREMYRNEIVYGFQGNRNPFIDHPEWVSCIYEGTGCGGGGGGGGDDELANGVPVTGLSGAQDEQTLFTLEVPAGASNLRFEIAGGSGDADLYVRHGSAPTLSTYDCRPWLSGNDEVCTPSAQAGTWYVMVVGYDPYSGVSLVGSYDTSGGGGGCTPVTLSRSNLSGSTGTELRYTIEVPSCATSLDVQMAGGSGDADLYVREGAAPTTSTWDCRPYRYGNDEACSFTNPQAGTWHIMVRGYDPFSGVALDATAD